MTKRNFVLSLLSLAVLMVAGCTASAKPTVEELRKEYPLYIQNPLWDGTWASVEGVLSEADSGVLATITDHEILRLKNKAADGSKAVPALQALEVQYERYTLRIDTVIFGENPGGEISLYLPYSASAMKPVQDIDQSTGKRFFYNLLRYPPERQQQLDTLLDCNGIRENRAIFMGGAFVYWTREGCMLSARPLKGVEAYDLMTKAEFIRAIKALRDSTTPIPSATP